MAEHQLTEAGANGQTSLRVVAPVGEVYSTEQEHALIHREWHKTTTAIKTSLKNISSSFQTFQKYTKIVMYVQSCGFAHETNCFKRLSLSSLWLLRRKKTTFWGDYINNSDHCESTTSGIVFFSRL